MIAWFDSSKGAEHGDPENGSLADCLVMLLVQHEEEALRHITVDKLRHMAAVIDAISAEQGDYRCCLGRFGRYLAARWENGQAAALNMNTGEQHHEGGIGDLPTWVAHLQDA